MSERFDPSDGEGQYADPRVFVCQGPPVCELQDEDAVRAQQMRAAGMKEGCPWCKVITVHPDGSETTEAPGRA